MHPEADVLVEIVFADVPHSLEAAFDPRATAPLVGILELDVQRYGFNEKPNPGNSQSKCEKGPVSRGGHGRVASLCF
jgi:hypothetical protein